MKKSKEDSVEKLLGIKAQKSTTKETEKLFGEKHLKLNSSLLVK